LVGFIEAKDDVSGGDNWNYKTCKAPVKSSPLTNQNPTFYKPFLLPNQQLSAAFDTIHYDILLQRLEMSFGVTGTALNWFQTYLSDRTQYILCGAIRSSALPLVCGVPRSTLGGVLFILHVADLAAVISQHSLSQPTAVVASSRFLTARRYASAVFAVERAVHHTPALCLNG